MEPLTASHIKSPLCLVAETVSHYCLTYVHIQNQTHPDAFLCDIIPFLFVQSNILYIQVECDYLCIQLLLFLPSTQYVSVHVDAAPDGEKFIRIFGPFLCCDICFFLLLFKLSASIVSTSTLIQMFQRRNFSIQCVPFR